MKNICKKSMLIMALMLTLVTVNVHAEDAYYTNLNGVEMSKAEYNTIVKIFSEPKASVISQEEFDEYKNANVVTQDTIYQKDIYQNGQLVSSEEITEEEYNNAPEETTSCDIMPLSDDSSYYGTSYKKLSVTLTDLNSYFRLIGNLSWKKIPVCRSYDVFAFRVVNMTYSSVTGIQTYITNSGSTDISYSSSSTGYKAQINGAGFSMNLKDDSNITGLELTLAAKLYPSETTAQYAHVYTSYQHAQNDVTRAQSMNYTLDISGLGNVVYYSNTTIRNLYDGMNGVQLTTPI
jgi:hypothetical protein